jgi:hypothetical protein
MSVEAGAVLVEYLEAEAAAGRTGRVAMSGAHLDSALERPGINDNGSGSAAQLEVALQMAELGVEPVNQVRRRSGRASGAPSQTTRRA